MREEAPIMWCTMHSGCRSMQCVTISPLPRDGAEIMRLGNVVSVMLTMKHYVPLFGTPLL